MYKGKRYNLIVVCLLLVISLLAGSSMGMVFSGKQSTAPELEGSDNSNPGFEEVDPNHTFNGLKQPSSNATAQTRLKYALAVMNYGKGYTSDSRYDIDVLGNHQYFYIKRYRAGEYDLLEEWYKMTGLLSSVGLNYFSGAIKTPNGAKTVVVTDTDHFSFDNRSYNASKATSVQEMTIAELTASKYGIPINDFFAPINSVDSPVLFENKGRGTDYYEIKVGLNGEKLKPQFFSAFDQHGPVSIDVEGITCTFKIDKKTGFFLRYDVEATFMATAYGFTKVRAYFSIAEKFFTMNKSSIDQIRPVAQNSYGIAIS